MDYISRQRRLQVLLGHSGLDALVITHLPDIRYLCGFTGSSAVLIVTDDRSAFFSDGRYVEQSRSEVRGSQIVISRRGPIVSAAEWLLNRLRGRKQTVGIDAEQLSVATRGRLSKILGSACKVKAAPPLVQQLRMVKDSEEIRLLKKAARLGSSLFDGLAKSIQPGISENEIAAELEYEARKAGAEQMSFPTIIASGRRSALPHGVASSALIAAKGFVVCDFGVILTGYCSDMTRTIHVGSLTREARSAYDAVLEAQQAAVAAVKPGVSVGAVDDAARKVLRKNSLSRHFTHSTGHGVGLEIHEPPRVAAGQTDILKPGMVVTIEPGVYIPGKWGIRIEDMVLVTESGCEVLTPTTKELIAL